MTNANPVASGLTSAEARRRLTEFGENRISSQRRAGALALFIAQFKSPIILILIGAAIVSLFLQDRTDATLILAIVLASACLDFGRNTAPQMRWRNYVRWSRQRRACCAMAMK